MPEGVAETKHGSPIDMRPTLKTDRMESVDILAVVNRLDNFLFRDVAGKGELHNESVDFRIFVESAYGFKQFFFGHIVLIADEGRAEAAGFTGFHFVGYVGFAASVVADKDGCEVGAAFALSHHFFDFSGNFALDVVGSLFSVYEGHSLCGVEIWG